MLDSFNNEPVTFIETTQVKPGVTCDVYHFADTEEKDLGIITIQPGHTTPMQKILAGDKTVEAHVSGAGMLLVINSDDSRNMYHCDVDTPLSVSLQIGDTMQWQANAGTELQCAEICFPPYTDDRFEDSRENW